MTKALQDHPEIAKETIRKVKERAKEMGYIPDFIGRSLSSRRTRTLGVVFPKIAHSFFSYSIERMYMTAREYGYNLIPTVSFEDEERELDNIRTLLSMRVDGIILDVAQNCRQNTAYELARQAGCKVLFFDRHPYSFTQSSVVTNDMKASYELTKLIIKKQYRRIYHFTGPSYLNISYERKRGYELAMVEADLPSHLFPVDLTRKSGRQALLKLAKSGDLPDSIFAVNDPVAHGIYDAAKELKLTIPGDLAVAGFGDIDASSLLQPPLTSIKPPLDKMSESAITTLIQMIDEDREVSEIMIFDSVIMERDSL